MKRSEQLEDARSRIADITNWTQGTFARDVFGTGVSTRSPEACQWCATGTLFVTDDKFRLGYRQVDDLYGELNTSAGILYGTNVVDVNDHYGHAVVIEVFDHAIARLKGEGK